MNVRNFKDELFVTGDSVMAISPKDSVMAISPKERECTKCFNILPLATGFYDDKRAKDGKSRQCIKCKDDNALRNEARRAVEPMCARAEAMKKLFRERFRVIKEAGLSIDKEGLATQNKIDRVLKKHGLFAKIRITHGALKRKSRCAKL